MQKCWNTFLSHIAISLCVDTFLRIIIKFAVVVFIQLFCNWKIFHTSIWQRSYDGYKCMGARKRAKKFICRMRIFTHNLCCYESMCMNQVRNQSHIEWLRRSVWRTPIPTGSIPVTTACFWWTRNSVIVNKKPEQCPTHGQNCACVNQWIAPIKSNCLADGLETYAHCMSYYKCLLCYTQWTKQ